MKEQKQSDSPIFCNNIMMEIFSWVPVKSLTQFKCVSKSLNSLISNPYFVKLHLERSNSKDNFDHLKILPRDEFRDFGEFYNTSCSVRSFLDHPLPPTTRNFLLAIDNVDKYNLIGSCNGLHCVLSDSAIYLWNMATRVRSSIPCFESTSEKATCRWGFGYDGLSDTYKVVVIVLYGDDDVEEELEVSSEVKVCDMGDNCWREVEGFPEVEVLGENDGMYLEGRLYWTVILHSEWVIYSMDLGKEAYMEFLLPYNFPNDIEPGPTLIVLKESLCLWHNNYHISHLWIWQLKESQDGVSWSPLVSLSYLTLQLHPLRFRSIIPLHISKNEDLLIISSRVNVDAQWDAFLYNLRTNHLEHVAIPTLINKFHPMIYVESLVLPR
ncbi:hypothetical protein RJT34_15952 [Clitoria ternatea]|uniref:F-box domain-containing protein n=1 Tax=Clitoria ternatea TaxID=43366 RepID=A0AAN9PCG6_CLITE